MDRFLKRSGQSQQHGVKGLTQEAWEMLRAYAWPGNLRELRNAIERAVIMARHEHIGPEDLPAELRSPPLNGAEAGTLSPRAGSMISLEKLDESHVRKILEQTSNLSEAADILGIDRATLYRKRKQLGME